MTTAVSEILKQVAFLSAEEQQELATQLLNRQSASPLQPEHPEETCLESRPPNEQESGNEDEDDENWLDTLDLKLGPSKRTYTRRVRYHFAGRLEPLPYDFGDFFDDEEESEE